MASQFKVGAMTVQASAQEDKTKSKPKMNGENQTEQETLRLSLHGSRSILHFYCYPVDYRSKIYFSQQRKVFLLCTVLVVVIVAEQPRPMSRFNRSLLTLEEGEVNLLRCDAHS